MVENIAPGIYRIKVPLPNNPLKYTNSYIVESLGNYLIIDTGLNNEACKEAITTGLKQLNINPKRADYFITHMHADHSGLITELSGSFSNIFISKEDAPFITCELNWDEFWKCSEHFATFHGFPKSLSKQAILHHPGYLYSPRTRPPGNIVIAHDSMSIKIGQIELKCISTPGHTPGHMCLYETTNNILFSGDHILCDITPNISAGCENKNPLASYLSSLEKTSTTDARLTLPGHRSLITNLNNRIMELKKHHGNRLKEISDILKKGKKHAYDVASLMKWDINYKDWNEFPIAQKWFAHSEAIAHLLYLEEKGRIR